MSEIPTTLTGKFITIDGPDYCGKGTQTRLLVSHLLDNEHDKKHKLTTVLATREPFNSPFGLQLRRLLATTTDPAAKANEFADLFIADRRVHLDNLILPSLNQGAIVVCDRYMYSTIAYQHAQGIPVRDLLTKQATFWIPDVSIIILPSVENIIKRKSAERNRPYEEVFEKSSEFTKNVRSNYTRMREWLPDHNIVMVDGDRTPQEIFNDIRTIVDKVVFG
ncbi:MAG: dTMP kinase, partial [Nanoarchaeota archaeon]